MTCHSQWSLQSEIKLIKLQVKLHLPILDTHDKIIVHNENTMSTFPWSEEARPLMVWKPADNLDKTGCQDHFSVQILNQFYWAYLLVPVWGNPAVCASLMTTYVWLLKCLQHLRPAISTIAGEMD